MGFVAIVLLVAALLAIGVVAGVVAGLLGVGGGMVLVPAFFYAFTTLGYAGPGTMQVCVATSLATIIFTSVRSVRMHDRLGAVDRQLLRAWAPGIAFGAVAGVLAVSQLRTPVLQGIFGMLGTCVAGYMLIGRTGWKLGDAMPVGALRMVISSVIGFFSVLMGIGGGSFGVPLMTLYGRSVHQAIATASGFGAIIALPSVIAFLFLKIPDAPPYTVGAVNVPGFAIVMLTTMFSTTWGVQLAHRMNPKPLKRVFAVFLGIVAMNMLFKSMGQ